MYEQRYTEWHIYTKEVLNNKTTIEYMMVQQ